MCSTAGTHRAVLRRMKEDFVHLGQSFRSRLGFGKLQNEEKTKEGMKRRQTYTEGEFEEALEVDTTTGAGESRPTKLSPVREVVAIPVVKQESETSEKSDVVTVSRVMSAPEIYGDSYSLLHDSEEENNDSKKVNKGARHPQRSVPMPRTKQMSVGALPTKSLK